MRRLGPISSAVALLLGSTAAFAQEAASTAPAAPSAVEAREPAATREALPLEYPPPGARTTLAVTGSAVFLGWYGVAWGHSLLEDDAPGAKDLRLPVVGPWMAVSQAGCSDGNSDCSKVWVVFRAILNVVEGVGQAGGLAVLGESLFLPTREPSRRAASTLPSVQPVPFVAGDSLGLGVRGNF